MKDFSVDDIVRLLKTARPTITKENVRATLNGTDRRLWLLLYLRIDAALYESNNSCSKCQEYPCAECNRCSCGEPAFVGDQEIQELYEFICRVAPAQKLYIPTCKVCGDTDELTPTCPPIKGGLWLGTLDRDRCEGEIIYVPAGQERLPWDRNRKTEEP